MTTITRTYAKNEQDTSKVRARTGGPRRPQGNDNRQLSEQDWFERYTIQANNGSHMPLDTMIHWDWRNPLNVIPALMLFLVLLTIVGMLVG